MGSKVRGQSQVIMSLAFSRCVYIEIYLGFVVVHTLLTLEASLVALHRLWCMEASGVAPRRP